MEENKENKMSVKEEFKQVALALVISGCLGIVGNFVGYNHLMPLESVPGMVILLLVAIVGWGLSKVVLKSFPSMVHISVVGMLMTIPDNPLSPIVVQYVDKIQLMAVVTPILAYAGLTVGRDWRSFLKIGWKAIIVGIVVIFAAFFWSALISDVLLRLTGQM